MIRHSGKHLWAFHFEEKTKISQFYQTTRNKQANIWMSLWNLIRGHTQKKEKANFFSPTNPPRILRLAPAFVWNHICRSHDCIWNKIRGLTNFEITKFQRFPASWTKFNSNLQLFTGANPGKNLLGSWGARLRSFSKTGFGSIKWDFKRIAGIPN